MCVCVQYEIVSKVSPTTYWSSIPEMQIPGRESDLPLSLGGTEHNRDSSTKGTQRGRRVVPPRKLEVLISYLLLGKNFSQKVMKMDCLV